LAALTNASSSGLEQLNSQFFLQGQLCDTEPDAAILRQYFDDFHGSRFKSVDRKWDIQS